MAVPRDPYLVGGPLEPVRPRDPNADTVLDETERGEDPARGEYLDAELGGLSRPLTDDEKEAAKHDPGRQPRTYAPASERVAKEPNPGDAKVIERGKDLPPSPESALHPGDRSDPSELR